MKSCKICGTIKPLSEFYQNRLMKEGYENACKACFCERQRQWKAANVERVRELNRIRNQSPEGRAYQKAWIASEAGKASHAQTTAKWRRNNRSKSRSHSLLNKAIYRGEIKRQPCEKCGAAKVDAHHDDYSKPLEVRWLCRKHHIEHHKDAENAVANAAYAERVAKGDW